MLGPPSDEFCREWLVRRRGPHRHEWNSWQGYLTAHERGVANYLDHFIVANELSYLTAGQTVVWSGLVRCVDSLEIAVDKDQEIEDVNGSVSVCTIKYRYHVLHRSDDGAVTNLWRYDNSHVAPGDPDAYHFHCYRADGSDAVMHVGEEGWPTLGDVIDDLHRWWRTVS